VERVIIVPVVNLANFPHLSFVLMDPSALKGAHMKQNVSQECINRRRKNPFVRFVPKDFIVPLENPNQSLVHRDISAPKEPIIPLQMDALLEHFLTKLSWPMPLNVTYVNQDIIVQMWG
jgi:hypothetical protein